MPAGPSVLQRCYSLDCFRGLRRLVGSDYYPISSVGIPKLPFLRRLRFYGGYGSAKTAQITIYSNICSSLLPFFTDILPLGTSRNRLSCFIMVNTLRLSVPHCRKSEEHSCPKNWGADGGRTQQMYTHHSSPNSNLGYDGSAAGEMQAAELTFSSALRWVSGDEVNIRSMFCVAAIR